jgi:hypothetical protein
LFVLGHIRDQKMRVGTHQPISVLETRST